MPEFHIFKLTLGQWQGFSPITSLILKNIVLFANYAKKQVFITNLFAKFTVQPNTDIFSYLAKDFRENKDLTCRKCTAQSCQSLRASSQETPNILLIQINRFSVSNLHGRPRKNNYPLGIYENIKLGLINYTLLGLIEHHGVFLNPGHYVSYMYIRQNNKWYHCDNKHITETNLLT